MTTVLVLGGLWVVVGIPAIIGILREHRSPDADFARAMDALGSSGPGQAPRSRLSAARRRAQVSGIVYTTAAALLAVGLVEGTAGLLAGAVVLANLGTFYRIVVLRLRVVAAQRHAPAQRSVAPAPPAPPAARIPPPPQPIPPPPQPMAPPAAAKEPVLVG